MGAIPASPEILIQTLKKKFPGAALFSVYEAGFSGFHLHRSLKKAGINNIVVNAAAIEVAINDRVKTDRRDALKMARHLKAQLLTSIYIPSIQTEKDRLIHRTRNQL